MDAASSRTGWVSFSTDPGDESDGTPHADFYQAGTNPTGEAASMDLALATRYGPPLLANLEGRGPLVRPEDAVVFGFRDAEEQKGYGSQPLPLEFLSIDLTTVRRMGVEPAVASALERVTRKPLDGFFIHFDADSLSDSIMPAVDYRLADGFMWEEITSILTLALDSQRAIRMELTIYNPALDRDGLAGRSLTDVVVSAVRPQSAARDR